MNFAVTVIKVPRLTQFIPVPYMRTFEITNKNLLLGMYKSGFLRLYFSNTTTHAYS